MKTTLLTLGTVVIAATLLTAQTRPAPAQPPKPAPAPRAEQPAQPRPPEPPAQPVNVKIEFTITDQAGPGQPSKKVITMITGDRQNNSIRSSASVRVATNTGPEGAPTTYAYRDVRINVDARPVLLKDDKLSLSFGLEYLPKASSTGGEALEPGMSWLNERLSLILESGKPVIVSQAADPASDRRITVEVIATILKYRRAFGTGIPGRSGRASRVRSLIVTLRPGWH